MNVTYDKLDNVNGEITVTIEEKDYADKVKQQLKEIGKKHAEPGFRPGKVPAGLIAKKYGQSVKYDVVNNLIGEGVYNYIKENNLNVLGQPIPKADNKFDINAAEFTFKFKVGVAPEIDNHVNKDLHVPYYNIQVSDAMVDEQVEGLRRRFGHQVSGEMTDETAVIKGAITELNEDGTEKENGVVVENGILAPVHFKDEDQKKLFAEKKVGDAVVFNPYTASAGSDVELSSMLGIEKGDVENHKGNFRFDIKDIIVLQPAELNQELFDEAVGKDKAHNEEEFRAAIKDLLALNLQGDSNYRFSIDAREAIEKAVGEIELPVETLKEFLLSQNKDLNAENVDKEFDSLRGQLTWDLVRDDIARKNDVKVTEEDLKNGAVNVVVRQLMQYGGGNLPQDMVEKYAEQVLKDEKNRERLAAQALDEKVFGVIKENVTLDNKDVTVEEFTKLFAPAEA